MLALEDVRKTYRGNEVLHGVSARFDRGVTVVIGPSGSGKSTLLRLLAGLEWPDAGRVVADGETLAPRRMLAHRRRLGYVIQEGGLFPHLTACANATLMARYLKRDADWIVARVSALATMTHLDEATLARYPAELSGGERQRVALMRALMLKPDILLLDEPLGSLDPLVRFELMTELATLFETLKSTVVFVTHDLGEAGYFADRVLLVHEGAIAQSGSFADLIERPADDFVRRFVRAQRPTRKARRS
ncbi:MAG: ATP-binding cassette domain-containing protein [Gammaproteobacteria bacterium]